MQHNPIPSQQLFQYKDLETRTLTEYKYKYKYKSTL